MEKTGVPRAVQPAVQIRAAAEGEDERDQQRDHALHIHSRDRECSGQCWAPVPTDHLRLGTA